jgi:hypothetical protein
MQTKRLAVGIVVLQAGLGCHLEFGGAMENARVDAAVRTASSRGLTSTARRSTQWLNMVESGIGAPR